MHAHVSVRRFAHGQPDVAELVHNAWLRTIEDGVHTYDIYKEGTSKQKVGTKEFAEAVAARVGQKPQYLKAASYSKAPKQNAAHTLKTGSSKKALVGVDAFFDWKERNPQEVGKKLEQLNGDGLKLFAVSNRGTKVYPEGFAETFCTDHWRARYMGEGAVSHAQIVSLLDRAGKANLDFIKIENLYTFDGQKGFVAEGE